MDADPASYTGLSSLLESVTSAAAGLASPAPQLLALLVIAAGAYFSSLHRLWTPAARESLTGPLQSLTRRFGTGRPGETAPRPALADLRDTTAREVMTSRVDLVGLPLSATLEDALDLVRTSGHSRLPVYGENVDDIRGVVYAKDLFAYVRPRQAGSPPVRIDWARIARPALFIPDGKPLHDLLREFQAKKTHLAIVVDEYGGTAGLVTMEDILEELVGDIRDEHDVREQPLFEQVGPDAYVFDARINLDDLNEVLGTTLDTEQFEFETLGGLIFHLTGAVPEPGEEIAYENLRLHVDTVDAHRIGRVSVRLAGAGEEPVEEQTVPVQAAAPHPARQAVGTLVVLEAAVQLLRRVF